MTLSAETESALRPPILECRNSKIEAFSFFRNVSYLRFLVSHVSEPEQLTFRHIDSNGTPGTMDSRHHAPHPAGQR